MGRGAFTDGVRRRVRERRANGRWLDVVLSVAEHDRSVGGGLLAGAIAFRLFLWLLPAALVVIGGLGFLVPTDLLDGSTDISGGATGLESFASQTVSQAAILRQTRWYALLIGVALLFWASHALGSALSTALALEWGMPVAARGWSVRLRGAAILTVSLLVAIASAAVATSLRRSVLSEIVTDLVLAALWAAVWWRMQGLLPHPPGLPGRRLWPGAVLVGVGLQVLHVVTVLYLSHQIANALSLYGVLGGAASILLWAYLTARLFTTSAALNLVLSRRPAPATPE